MRLRSGTQKTRRRVARAAAGGLLAVCLSMTGAQAAPKATLKAGTTTLSVGEAATFAIRSSASEPSDLTAWCEVRAGGGRVSVAFDAERYIPLSAPSVGDVITLDAGERRRFDLYGSVNPHPGDAYIAFRFTGVPSSFCFPGMDCGAGPPQGGTSVAVACGQD